MKEEDLKGARSKLGLKGEVKSKTYEVMVECGKYRLSVTEFHSDIKEFVQSLKKQQLKKRLFLS